MDQAAVVSGHLSLGGFDAKMAQRVYTGVGILRVPNLGGVCGWGLRMNRTAGFASQVAGCHTGRHL